MHVCERPGGTVLVMVLHGLYTFRSGHTTLWSALATPENATPPSPLGTRSKVDVLETGTNITCWSDTEDVWRDPDFTFCFFAVPICGPWTGVVVTGRSPLGRRSSRTRCPRTSTGARACPTAAPRSSRSWTRVREGGRVRSVKKSWSGKDRGSYAVCMVSKSVVSAPGAA